MSASNQCRRCLLQEMTDENDYYQSVVRYRAALPAKKAHTGRGIRRPAGLLQGMRCPERRDLYAVRLLCGDARGAA